MLSGALTSFLTGITEPLEFSFLFVAPLLFFIHAVLDGLSFLIMYVLHVYLGYTFSGGFIDFLLLNIMPNKTKHGGLLYLLVLCMAYYTTLSLDLLLRNSTIKHQAEKIKICKVTVWRRMICRLKS